MDPFHAKPVQALVGAGGRGTAAFLRNFPEPLAIYSTVVPRLSGVSKVITSSSWKWPACAAPAILILSLGAQLAVAATGVTAATAATGAGGGNGSTAAPAPEPGVWQQHKYSFAFLGFTSTYSCDGLADKLKVLLIAAGARPDAKSTPGACAADYGRPDKFARADLSFYTLVPDSSDKGAAVQPVQGVWRSVDLQPHEPRELGIGDCELVEQFRDSVLPMFATRNVDSHTTCIPYEDSGSTLALKFDAFAAAPAAVAAAAH